LEGFGVSRFESLRFCAFAFLALAGCAGEKSNPLTATPVTPELVAEAKKAGYRVVTTKAGPLFCKNTMKTGSHLVTNECHTAQEWNFMHDKDDALVRDALGNTATPGSNVGK
jgi:hypothetical protein